MTEMGFFMISIADETNKKKFLEYVKDQRITTISIFFFTL